MITLAVDASTYAGDIAVLDDARVLAEESVAMRGAEHEHLMPAVAAALGRAGIGPSDLDRIVCGAGPGSFTSLRIAGAIAKGIASATGRSLYAVSSLGLIVGGTQLPDGVYLAAIDAMRGEFYVGLYEVVSARAASDDSIVELEPPRIVPSDAVDALAAECGARVIGPAARSGGIQAAPRAHAAARMERTLARNGPVNLATWEPSYGRLAEAQVRWERTHGRPLSSG